uniref:Uncharacterized protein n=1 Tax=Arundo donax TaxID=35708 RepID=A0A0A9GVG3_ARUDO
MYAGPPHLPILPPRQHAPSPKLERWSWRPHAGPPPPPHSPGGLRLARGPAPMSPHIPARDLCPYRVEREREIYYFMNLLAFVAIMNLYKLQLTNSWI